MNDTECSSVENIPCCEISLMADPGVEAPPKTKSTFDSWIMRFCNEMTLYDMDKSRIFSPYLRGVI